MNPMKEDFIFYRTLYCKNTMERILTAVTVADTVAGCIAKL